MQIKMNNFIIKKATYTLYCNKNIEDTGECQVDKDEKNNGYYIDAKIFPEKRSTRYSLEITLEIADEVIKTERIWR